MIARNPEAKVLACSPFIEEEIAGFDYYLAAPPVHFKGPMGVSFAKVMGVTRFDTATSAQQPCIIWTSVRAQQLASELSYQHPPKVEISRDHGDRAGDPLTMR